MDYRPWTMDYPPPNIFPNLVRYKQTIAYAPE